MTHNTGARSWLDPTADGAESLDRILLAVCAAIWLGVLGSGVAATVALVDLGSAHPEPSTTTSSTPWLLYAVIAVSALVIVGAIPLLVRARRAALDDPRTGRGAPARPVSGQTQTAARPVEPRTQQLRPHQPGAGPQRGAFATATRISTFDAALPPAVDRLWLRCSVVIASAMGVALLAVGIATYLMAAGYDAAAWSVYVVAGLVTLAMPVIPIFYLRQLHQVLDASGP